MNQEQLRRLGFVAGAGVFVLALIAQFSRVDPGLALLLSIGAGFGFGLAVYLAGSVVAMPPAAPDQAPPSAEAAPGAESPYELPPLAEAGERPTEKTAAEGADLHQTVRLDEGGVDYVLPEVSPEELFKEREGIDEEFLRQGMGIEEAAVASENVNKGTEEGGN